MRESLCIFFLLLICLFQKTHLKFKASEYWPSDIEANVSSTFLIKSDKYNDKLKKMIRRVSRELFPQQKAYSLIAEAYRFNPDKQKWVRKGPVATFTIIDETMRFLDGCQNRMLAYLMHGTLGVVFNFRGKEQTNAGEEKR